MREIQPEAFRVFQLDELEPVARQRAIEKVAGLLSGDWWDQHDIDNVSDTIRYALAGALKTPGWDTSGEGDFPGIPGLQLQGWDLDRAQSLHLDGELNRENAPALPWATGVRQVQLQTTMRDYTSIDIITSEDDLDPYQERDLTVVREELKELAATMAEAVENAIEVALKAGMKHLEFVGSEENAIDYIEGNDCEFLADGTRYQG